MALFLSSLVNAQHFNFTISSDILFDTSRSVELQLGFNGATNEFKPLAQRFLRGDRLDIDELDKAVQWFMWSCSFPDAERAMTELLKLDDGATNQFLAGLVYVARGDYATAKSRLERAEAGGHRPARTLKRHLTLFFAVDVEDMLPEISKDAAAKDLEENELITVLMFTLRSEANGSKILKALNGRPDLKQLLRDNPTAMRLYLHSCRLRNVKSIIEDPDGKASG